MFDENDNYMREVNNCLQQAMSIMKLQSIQIKVSQMTVSYLCELNNINDIPCKEVDKNVIQTFHKVMTSNSFEFAEASYVKLQDACAIRMGFEDYISFEKAACEAIKSGQSVHKFFEDIVNNVKENNDE
jgi:division protein CdvB (Snf7/Vps24/ESCRT-III family)